MAQAIEKAGWRETFLERDLPVAYTLVRATMGFHMIAHGSVRIPKLAAFAAETRMEFQGVTLLGLPIFQDWAVTILAYIIPNVEFTVGLLLAVGFKTRLATIVANVMFLVMMFGTVAQGNFATGHVMWWYVLIFATIGGLNFADKYSLDRMGK
jgi:thiosulfate dehydrogenase [quinone] large subunit